MSSGIQLIVGLGNPGAEYEKTRHNAGAWFVTELADATNVVLRPDSKLSGLHGIAKLHGHACHLLIPTTYMNLSGQPVQALASYYKIAPDAILVAHDEIDLPVGDIRLKFDGGHGGHNGIRDVMKHINNNKFYRLRIGVGRPEKSSDSADYVLHPPKKAERTQIDAAMQKANQIIPLVLAGQFQKAMQELHTIEK